MLKVESRSLDFYLELMDSRKPFSFMRYGDGEWAAILGEEGENCDGHQYFAGMGQDLARTLEQPREIHYGLMRIAEREYGERIENWMGSRGLPATFEDGHAFLDASWQGELYPLIARLRRMEILLVGPEHLFGLSPRVIDWSLFRQIPNKNCWLDREGIQSDILRAADAVDLIAFSAGPATPVLIWNLFPLIGSEVTMIDFGSLWDVYVGVRSRSYARRLDWPALIPKNLGETGGE